MSGILKQRAVTNSENTKNINEIILRECHKIYADNENGLLAISKMLKLQMVSPRKKISVMLIGNHSAGKSSFINWYIEEHVQKTGVAIETQGFSLITSGKRRETLTGNATLHLYPHYQSLAQIKNLVNHLSTEVSTSKQKKFPLVTFIDTPGLVDGDMKYPFDVDKAILWLGSVVDLVFVFFDPIGQALCKRTLNIVEKLNKENSGRMKFCLSKADEAGHESDRQRVMMQIVQEICKRPGLNGTCFDMPTIFIPSKSKQVRCVNQIDDMCKDIAKTIDLTIQNTLNQLEKDCDTIKAEIDKALKNDNDSRLNNRIDFTKGFIVFSMFVLLKLLLVVDIFVYLIPATAVNYWIGKDVYSVMNAISQPFDIVRDIFHIGRLIQYVGFFLALIIPLFITSSKLFYQSRRPVMTKRQQKTLLERQKYISSHVCGMKNRLYKQYLEQTIFENDLT